MKTRGPFLLEEWQVRPSTGEIARGGERVRLEPKVMELLLLFVAHPGEVLSKEQILEELWPKTFVSEGVVFRHVSELRRLLGDDARQPRFLQTIPKKGYTLLPRPQPLGENPRAADAEDDNLGSRSLSRWVTMALIAGSITFVAAHRLLDRRLPKARTGQKARISASPAFENFMRGQLFEDRVDCQSYLEAQRAYGDALRQDPRLGENYKALMDTLVASGVLGCEAAPVLRQSLGEFLDASRTVISPRDYQVASAQLAFWFQWNLPEAARAFGRARSLEAVYDADSSYGAYLLSNQQIAEGLSELRQCLSEEPTHVGVNWSLGVALYLVGQYEDAIGQLDKTLELFPGFSPARHVLALSYWAKGDIDRALTIVADSPLLPERTPDRFDAVPGFLYAMGGQRSRAEQALRAWEHRAREHWVPSTALALLHLGLDERDEALKALEAAHRERDPWLLFVSRDPAFATLRDELRFRTLLAGTP